MFTNLEAVKIQAKLICNTCYVDDDAAKLSLFNHGIDADGQATPNDKEIIRVALDIVKGWVETSRSEGGISVSTDMARLRKGMIYWSKKAGLDPSEFVDDDDVATISDGSNMW